MSSNKNNDGAVQLTQNDTARINAFFGQGSFSDKVDANPQLLSQQKFEINSQNLHPFPLLNFAGDYLQQALYAFESAQLNTLKDKKNLDLKEAIDKQVERYSCSNAIELFKKYSNNDGLVHELYKDFKEQHTKENHDVIRLNNLYQEFNTAYGEYQDHFLDEYSACTFDEQHKLGIVEKHAEFIDRINQKAGESLSASAFMVENTGKLEFASDQFASLAELKTQQYKEFNSPASEQKAENTKDFNI